MNSIISQKFKSLENSHLIILSSIFMMDIMNNPRNITNQTTPALLKINLNEYSNLLEKIKGFSNLQYNWDSYNADIISNVSINTSIETLDYMTTKGLLTSNFDISVFPMRDGGIQFEFDGEYICAELEINQNGDLTFILFDDDGNIINEWRLFELSELPILLEEAEYA